MRLSCLPVSLFPELISGEMTVPEWLSFAKEIGLDAADISVHFIPVRTIKYIDGLRKDIADVGLPIAMMTTYPDFTAPEAVNREIEVIHSLSDIALASQLGIEYIRITAGQLYPGQPEEKTIENIYECFERCCDAAERLGVKLLIENHSKPGAWEREDFVFKTERFLAVADRIKTLPIGINFDTANTFVRGDDCVSLFKQLFNRIETIHINDAKEIGKLEFCGSGKGIAPIEKIIDIAKERSFSGLLSIEDVSGDGKTGIAEAVKYVRGLMQPATKTHSHPKLRKD